MAKSSRKPNGSQTSRRAKTAAPKTNGAKPAGGVGHNRQVSAKTFFECVRSIDECTRKKETAVANLRNAYKRADEAGIDVKQLKVARKLRTFTEPEIATDLNRLIAYAKHLKVPVYSDLPMREVESPSEDDVMQQARDRGLVAGRIGEGPEKNPWTLDTPAGREWAKSREEGEQEIRTGLA
jgi:hypothetical protein